MENRSTDATSCRSLRLLLEYTGPGTVEDVFCRTFAIEDERAGVLEVIELVPGGADIPVTEENRRDFVDKYVDWVLVKSVEDQYNAFREGTPQFGRRTCDVS